MPAVAGEFPQDLIYLNHAGVGPWPARAAAAVADFARTNVHRGAADYPDWLAVERRLRGQLAALIGGAPDEVALLKNTSEGLSLVAMGLPWRAGERIVTTNREFPSNRLPWLATAARGVALVEVDIAVDDPEAALIAALDARTRVLAVSAVQFGDGLRLDLARLGAACRANGTLFVVDAIQQIGALPFDVGAAQADIVVADGHKWMLGPEGLALFWVRAAVREQLALQQFGWHMLAKTGDYDSRDATPAADARRFECGSPNMLGIHALSASLSLLLETGMAQVGERVLANAGLLAEQVAREPGWTLLSRRDGHYASGIVTFRHASGEHARILRGLKEAGVIAAERGGGIRLSPHFYHAPEQLARVAHLMRQAAAG